MTAMMTTDAGRIAQSVQELAVLPTCVHVTMDDLSGREVRALVILDEERRTFQKDSEFFDRESREEVE